MDDDERDESGSENEQDEMMEDAEDMDHEQEPDADAEEDDNENEEDEDEDQEGDDADPDPEPDQEADADADLDPDADGSPDAPAKRPATAPGSPSTPRWRPQVRPEYLKAQTYDIVPTMAAPQATSINALAVTPDMRFWITGGSDGYIRKYDGIGTVNGKQLLTVAQRHPFVDSVTKAGILMSYWENEEPPVASSTHARGLGAGADEHLLSPVYSLAVHSQALWLLSGLESGGINLQSVRHDEGKRIHCLQGGHTNAVSVLRLAPDERSVLSGGWDRGILDWDLNTGQVIRRFDGRGGQISALELRPTSGAPVPAIASEVYIKSDTIATNNDQPLRNMAMVNGTTDATGGASATAAANTTAADAPAASPAHESLFGSPAGSLFGDNDAMGGNAFGGEDDDDEFSRAMEMTMNEEAPSAIDQGGDFAMADANAAPSTVAGPTEDAVGADALPVDDVAAEAPKTDDVTMDLGDNSMADEPSATLDQPEQQLQAEHNAVIDTQPPPTQDPPPLSPPTLVYTSTTTAAPPNDTTQTSSSTFLSASIDGSIRVWDRRVPDPVARINNRPGVPPWCMGACWSPDGNRVFVGRRNGSVDEYDVRNAWSGWTPERTLRFPGGSGAVSCVRAMPNGRHLICASHDILRLYDLEDQPARGSTVPFLIVPGPPRPGVIADLYIDPTSRFMISIAGTRGWEGNSTETVVGYEINVPE